MTYKPRPGWNEAVERADKERKEFAQKSLENHLKKKEKEKIERQKGKRK